LDAGSVGERRQTREAVTAVAIICSSLGGACEMGGLVLVAFGINADRARARALFDKPVKVERPEVGQPDHSRARSTKKP